MCYYLPLCLVAFLHAVQVCDATEDAIVVNAGTKINITPYLSKTLINLPSLVLI